MSKIRAAEEFVDRVRGCAEKYLYGPLNRAQYDGEHPYTIAYALLGCIGPLLETSAPDRKMAILHLQGMVKAYITDWEEQS